jgi:hypothetical protein
MMYLDRQIGWDGRGRYRKATARIPNDGRHKEAGNFKVQINDATSVIDEWLNDDGLFTQDEFAAIWYCGEMWRRIGLTVRDRNEKARASGLSDRRDYEAQRALNAIARIRKHFDRTDWNIFENVIRWNEPCGRPGSAIAMVPGSSIEAAKLIVKGIAREIYESGFFKKA